MPTAGVGDAAETFEPIGDDGGAFGDNLLGDALHSLLLEAGDAAQLKAVGRPSSKV
jgi:hypothetical protein